MNWTLVFIDREFETCGIVQMNNPTQGQIDVYHNELVERYPRSFGIRLIKNKNVDTKTIQESIPDVKKFKIVNFADFI